MYLNTIWRRSVQILLSYQPFHRGEGGFWWSLPWNGLINLHPQVNWVASTEGVCSAQQCWGALGRWGDVTLAASPGDVFEFMADSVCFLSVSQGPSTVSCRELLGMGWESRMKKEPRFILRRSRPWVFSLSLSCCCYKKVTISFCSVKDQGKMLCW